MEMARVCLTYLTMRRHVREQHEHRKRRRNQAISQKLYIGSQGQRCCLVLETVLMVQKHIKFTAECLPSWRQMQRKSTPGLLTTQLGLATVCYGTPLKPRSGSFPTSTRLRGHGLVLMGLSPLPCQSFSVV